jgi:cullin-4
LIAIVEKHLIHSHLDYILSGFNQLAKNLRKEDIKRMYSLISRISQLDRLRDTWKSYVKDTGLDMIKAENPLAASAEGNKEKSLVQDLLDFKQQLDQLLEEAFNKSEPFTYALKEAFESFINSRANKPAELIAKYVDSKLKGGKKGLSEEELELVLDKVLILFRFIHGKDIFEAFYKKDLAKRLLLQKSSSFDAEKLMISKLKAECGASFTNKLEGMFKDIDISKDIMAAFKSSPFHSQLSAGLDLYVHVLTAGYWPAYPVIEVTLPKQMSDYQEVFKKFYLNKHSGRRLTFQNALGYCTLRANFKAGKKELLLSVFQTVVLLAFNSIDNMSFTDIKATTNLEDKELKRVLYSLSSGKVKLLIKQTKTKDINEEDIFTYNKDFKFKLYRIKVNTIQMKETVEENQKTTQTVMHDRQYQIDAAIVRIMKTRKSLSHTKLVNEVLSQLKFDIRVSEKKEMFLY